MTIRNNKSGLKKTIMDLYERNNGVSNKIANL